MNSKEFRFVDGTSALVPDCSRYRNENERIISFERAASNWERGIDYTRLSKAKHASRSERMRAGMIATMDKSQCFHDMRTGTLEGTSFDIKDDWKVKAYGCLYTVAALGTIIATTI